MNRTIELRNILEHRYVSKSELDSIIFAECQALLYNFENLLVDLWGDEFSLNESLSFSLQFSKFRNENEKISKTALSEDVMKIRDFVNKYRSDLEDTIFSSMEYSIKLIQIPNVSNNRTDASIEFVNYDILNEKEKESYEHFITFIKEKTVRIPVQNYGKYRPQAVVDKVNSTLKTKYPLYLNECFYKILQVRPIIIDDSISLYDTNTKYCIYDEPNDVYLYTDKWTELIISILENDKVSFEYIKKLKKGGSKLNIEDFEK